MCGHILPGASFFAFLLFLLFDTPKKKKNSVFFFNPDFILLLIRKIYVFAPTKHAKYFAYHKHIKTDKGSKKLLVIKKMFLVYYPLIPSLSLIFCFLLMNLISFEQI